MRQVEAVEDVHARCTHCHTGNDLEVAIISILCVKRSHGYQTAGKRAQAIFTGNWRSYPKFRRHVGDAAPARVQRRDHVLQLLPRPQREPVYVGHNSGVRTERPNIGPFDATAEFGENALVERPEVVIPWILAIIADDPPPIEQQAVILDLEQFVLIVVQHPHAQCWRSTQNLELKAWWTVQ